MVSSGPGDWSPVPDTTITSTLPVVISHQRAINCQCQLWLFDTRVSTRFFSHLYYFRICFDNLNIHLWHNAIMHKYWISVNGRKAIQMAYTWALCCKSYFLVTCFFCDPRYRSFTNSKENECPNRQDLRTAAPNNHRELCIRWESCEKVTPIQGFLCRAANGDKEKAIHGLTILEGHCLRGMCHALSSLAFVLIITLRY